MGGGWGRERDGEGGVGREGMSKEGMEGVGWRGRA